MKQRNQMLTKKIKIAPSILSADFANLGRQVKELETDGADLIHIDVMDGHFVPNITMGPVVVEAIRGVTSLPFDVHLMIEHPEKYAGSFIDAGADMVSFHAEASVNPKTLIQLLKQKGVKAGIAINPATPYKAIKPFVKDLDFILVMTVNPGFSGQAFMEDVLEKVKTVKKHFDEEGLTDIEIEIDGGINGENVDKVIEAGVDIIVAGSYVFKGDIAKNIKDLKAKYAAR
jgi:ribulose-phosphate 3-epimerase